MLNHPSLLQQVSELSFPRYALSDVGANLAEVEMVLVSAYSKYRDAIFSPYFYDANLHDRSEQILWQVERYLLSPNERSEL